MTSQERSLRAHGATRSSIDMCANHNQTALTIKAHNRLAANHNQSALTLKVHNKISANHNRTILPVVK